MFSFKSKTQKYKIENPENTIIVHFPRRKTKHQRLPVIAIEVVFLTEMDLEEKFSLAVGWGAGFAQIEFDILF